ncbi:MAG: hypothetical protein ABT16_00235 [Rhodanobacter sp. SCN 65-17]|nr:MAG: hypothetical protein ABT16_00235 [Rhodanobacter sp. SCN 65-17]
MQNGTTSTEIFIELTGNLHWIGVCNAHQDITPSLEIKYRGMWQKAQNSHTLRIHCRSLDYIFRRPGGGDAQSNSLSIYYGTNDAFCSAERIEAAGVKQFQTVSFQLIGRRAVTFLIRLIETLRRYDAFIWL